MFRCPTCITVLTDPSSRRCQTCRRRLRRRGPRVLGEERRAGARMLPIDRALNERLHAVAGRRDLLRGDPWAGRFRVAEPARPGATGPEPEPAVAPFVETPAYEPMAVEPGPLDPDIQALVDDLYRQARAEIGSSLEGHEAAPSPIAAPQPPANRRTRWVPAVLIDPVRAEGLAIDGFGIDGTG